MGWRYIAPNPGHHFSRDTVGGLRIGVFLRKTVIAEIMATPSVFTNSPEDQLFLRDNPLVA